MDRVCYIDQNNKNELIITQESKPFILLTHIIVIPPALGLFDPLIFNSVQGVIFPANLFQLDNQKLFFPVDFQILLLASLHLGLTLDQQFLHKCHFLVHLFCLDEQWLNLLIVEFQLDQLFGQLLETVVFLLQLLDKVNLVYLKVFFKGVYLGLRLGFYLSELGLDLFVLCCHFLQLSLRLYQILLQSAFFIAQGYYLDLIFLFSSLISLLLHL